MQATRTAMRTAERLLHRLLPQSPPCLGQPLPAGPPPPPSHGGPRPAGTGACQQHRPTCRRTAQQRGEQRGLVRGPGHHGCMGAMRGAKGPADRPCGHTLAAILDSLQLLADSWVSSHTAGASSLTAGASAWPSGEGSAAPSSPGGDALGGRYNAGNADCSRPPIPPCSLILSSAGGLCCAAAARQPGTGGEEHSHWSNHVPSTCGSFSRSPECLKRRYCYSTWLLVSFRSVFWRMIAEATAARST